MYPYINDGRTAANEQEVADLLLEAIKDPATCAEAAGPSEPSVSSEISKLFTWGGANISSKSKGKGKRLLSNPSKGPKKKKLKTWTHTFVCLSSTKHMYVPDATERTTLKLAGLGEKRFGVFAYNTAPELQDELFREFPKLVSAAGFELLRASEFGGRELVLIDIPSEGYSVEYLQAVVKGAKIYIRPLQKDLDESPLENKVSNLGF